ncbi:MAG: hypothetical protein L3J11_01315 [Draconibacterium sp.]|nr:hypothetical protein [Draconibacterium sp.]
MFLNINLISIFLFLMFLGSLVSAQTLDDFEYRDSGTSKQNPVITEFQFNGYTNHWHNSYQKWVRNGTLFKMSIDNVEYSIIQSKVDIAEDMGIPGLNMQEGFFWNLTSSDYQILELPDKAELVKSLETENVLVFVDPKSLLGKELTKDLHRNDIWPEKLKSYQYNSKDLKRIDAFFLQKNNKKLFVVSSADAKTRERFKQLIKNTENVIQKYNFYKGWFGAETLLKSVTCAKGHPLEVIGAGMNEGNSWFVFSGYMDFLAKDELDKWLDEVKLPIVTDVGFSPIFGCSNYDGFQDRLMYTKESWVNYAHKKDGFVFRNVWDTKADPYHYDGYFATEGNKEQIDKENVPFVLKTGKLDENATSGMVLFLDKGKQLTRENMWEAILDRREVGVLEKGKMLGPALFRNTLQMLLLDRMYLEEYFGDRINLQALVDGYDLQVKITNTYSHSVSGTLELTLPPNLDIKAKKSISIDLQKGITKILHFSLLPTSGAMNNTNPLAVHFKWNGKKKSTLTMLDLPPAISVHRLLYAHAPKISYPLTIHNFTAESSFPVKIQVVETDNLKKVVYETSQSCSTETGTFKNMHFDLVLPAGNYKIKVSALGIENISQLGVGKAEGEPTARRVDLNNDGIDEYRLENDSVQITLLSTGARIIEYIVKSRNDNVLFKLWPNKTGDDKEPFRERGFYPYGGFEDFLGQGSMENHQVYNAEIVKSEGDFVRVKMWTDYFGNRLEKTFTLYGDSPLLEVRFALTFKNPEANILGPQPMLALGDRHWTEDVFTVPELDGLHEYRMRPEKRYGMIFHLKEGWNAGYDTKQDISFVGAYPVNQLLFLHMFLNEPGNHSSHYFYGEFQPWIPIFQKSTMYFTYYLWGAGGPWENGVNVLREMNLITTK